MNGLTMLVEAGSATSAPVITTDDITTATNSIFTVVGQVLNQIVSNPVFLIFFVSGLIFTGVSIIRRLKRV